MWSFYGSEVFVFLLRDIVEIGDITPWGNKKIKKKEGKAYCGGNGVSQPPCRVQWAKGLDGEHVFVNDMVEWESR